MAITRERKEELVAIYTEMLSHASGLIIIEYRGLSAAKLDELRAKLREVNGAYIVTKNTLFKIALRSAGWIVADDLLEGPVATAFADGNLPGVAKAVLAFQKDNPELFIVKGGLLTGRALTPAQVEMLAELPSLDELRAQIAGLLVQPATGLVSVLNSATSQIVNVLHAYVQENTESSGEAA